MTILRFFTCILILACLQAKAAPGPAPSFITARAKLLKPVAAVAAGSSVSAYFTLVADWQTGDCRLPAGTVLSAKLDATESAARGSQKIGLSLHFEPLVCAHQEEAEVTPMLVAMEAVPPSSDSLKRMATAAMEQQTIQNLFFDSNSSVAAGMKPDHVTNTEANSTQVFNTTGFNGSSNQELKTGEVRGLRGISMTLPNGEPVTTLRSAHPMPLGRDIEFVLYFVSSRRRAAVTQVVASLADSTLQAPAAAVHAARVPIESEVCAASGCVQLAPATMETRNPGSALWTLSLAHLGFAPQANKTLFALDEDANVFFLGEDELLVTFRVHGLIKRTAEEYAQGLHPRVVRAVLLSRATGHVLRQEDWIVPDAAGPYIWAAGGGRILAHLGERIVLLGPELVEKASFQLPGPLLFVSASPEGQLFLVATMHERHTRQEHAKLLAVLGPDLPIQEEYDLAGLNGNLQQIGTRRFGVEPVEPALISSASLSASMTRDQQWQLDESSWSGEKRILATLGSGCGLTLEAIAPRLLFAHGCSPTKPESAWFRVLTPQGATLLKASLPPFQLLLQAQSDASGDLLAVASSQFDKRVDMDGGLSASSFQKLKVSVYSAATGKPLLTLAPAGGSALKHTLALSPSGATLAVFSGGSLQAYAIPAQ